MSRPRRPRHHTYDYNFKVGESGYSDMLDYLDRKEARRQATPPSGNRTFAERFAERPFYGELKPLSLGGSSTGAAELQSAPRASSALPDQWPAEGRQRADRGRRARFAEPEQDDFLSPKSRSKLEPSPDADTDKLIESIRGRRLRLQQMEEAEASSRELRSSRLSSADVEDFGKRTRRAIQDIDEDFKNLGLYDGSSSKLTSSGSSYSANMRSSSSKETSSTSRRTVRYED